MNAPETIPAGYMKAADGSLKLISMVKPIDIERDKLVRDIAAKAKALNSAIATFKAATFGDIGAFVELSAEQYGAKVGGQKGNITLLSFDGRHKVQRAIAEHISFDERLQAAKSLIDECITDWSQGSRPEIQVLVNDAFRVDQEGKINTGRVLGLRRLDIRSEKWQRAMQAISDAVQVVGSKSYIRVYERDDATGEYFAIPLDVASA